MARPKPAFSTSPMPKMTSATRASAPSPSASTVARVPLPCGCISVYWVRVAHLHAGTLLPPPYKLVDNDVSLLDISDLVFIDPVSTGYSRAVPGEAPKQYHGITV